MNLITVSHYVTVLDSSHMWWYPQGLVWEVIGSCRLKVLIVEILEDYIEVCIGYSFCYSFWFLFFSRSVCWLTRRVNLPRCAIKFVAFEWFCCFVLLSLEGILFIKTIFFVKFVFIESKLCGNKYSPHSIVRQLTWNLMQSPSWEMFVPRDIPC